MKNWFLIGYLILFAGGEVVAGPMTRQLYPAPAAAATPAGRTATPTTQTRTNGAIHPAVVRVIAPGKGSVSFGSGTLIFANGDQGLVVTNWHVINEATDTITVLFSDGFASKATIRKVDKDWDLAALEIRRPPGVEPVTLAARPPRPGEMLTIAGYGSGTYRSVSGECTQYVAPGLKFPYEMVELAASARQGDSGGPILNAQGELAGVLFGEGRGRTSGSYCGRVQWFLTAVTPAGGATTSPASSWPPVVAASVKPAPMASRPSEVATRATPNKPSASVAPISRPSYSQRPIYEQQYAPQANSPVATISQSNHAPGAAPSASVVKESTQTIGWEQIAGHTLVDQLKTVLAGIGALALVLHTARWLNS